MSRERTAAGLPPVGAGGGALYRTCWCARICCSCSGFRRLLEKEWHRLLTTVQGVGAKASMAILGTLGADGVGRAIALGDWSAVKAAPGRRPETGAAGGDGAEGQGAVGDGAWARRCRSMPGDDTVIEDAPAPGAAEKAAPSPQPAPLPPPVPRRCRRCQSGLYRQGEAAQAVAQAAGDTARRRAATAGPDASGADG